MKANLVPHDCIPLIHIACYLPFFPHLISLFPISDSDHTWFIDGSSSKPNQFSPGKAGYAAASHTSIIEAATILPSATSQQAELIAFTCALTLEKGLSQHLHDSK